MPRFFGSRVVRWGLLLFLLGIPLRAHAQTINAATCSSTDVQTALSSVKADGTIVNIPAGTCTWTAKVSYNQVYSTTIQGQTTCTGTGTQSPSCTDNTTISGQEAYLTIQAASGKFLRITGFTFQVGSTYNGLFYIKGRTTQLRIDHNHFYHMQAVAIVDGPLGVIDHNFFDFNTSQSVYNGIRMKQNNWNGYNWGDGSWADNSYFGSSKFLYFEDNTAYNGFIDDCDTGARFVMRHNYFHDAAAQAHEMQGRWNGCRAYEFYNNTLFSDLAGEDTADAVLLRTGTGLFWGNTITSYGNFVKVNNDRSNTSHLMSPTGYSACIAAAGSYSCWGMACNNASQPNGTDCATTNSLQHSPSGFDGNTDIYGYPAFEQVGRGKGDLLPQYDFNTTNFWATEPTWPHQALEPLYLWSNTLLGGSNLRSAIYGASLFQENRDWFTDNSGSTGVRSGTSLPGTCTPQQGFWDTSTNTLYQCAATNTWTTYYTPFTYPHPLVSSLSSGSVASPAPPTGLTAVVQ